jgi:cytochrome P450
MTRMTIEFDHHSPDFAQHKREIYTDLRSRCPIAETGNYGGFYILSKYDDVVTVAKNPDTFASGDDRVIGGYKQGVNVPSDSVTPAGGVLQMDPPLHNEFRRLVSAHWSPTAARNQQARWENYTNWLIDKFIERGEIEIISALLSPLPAMVTLNFLGIPVDSYTLYSDAMHEMMYTPPDSPNRPRVEAMLGEMKDQLSYWGKRKRAEPQDDYLSFLNTVEIGGKVLTDEQVLAEALLVIGGGLDTTTTLLEHTLIHLHRNHDHRDWLLADRSRLTAACEEFLRYYAPVPGLGRTVVRECTIRDTTFVPRDRVFILMHSANLDEEAFPHADKVILDRPNNKHVAFGTGQHRCLGQHQARQMWATVLWQVLIRFPDYRVLEDEVEGYPAQGTTAGFVKMPVRFTPGRSLGIVRES